MSRTRDLTREPEGRLRYLNGNMTMGADRQRGRAFEPLMRRVNAIVEQRCGLPIARDGKITVL